MEIHLKDLRKRAGISQEEMADRLGVKTSRYGTWERGDRMLSLEQAYNCAVILGCTIDEIAGYEHAGPLRSLAPDEAALVAGYRELDAPRRDNLMSNARFLAAEQRKSEVHPDPRREEKLREAV